MTAEEIKQTYTMREIAERYGIKVKRDGMCCCPFHGEKHPSMKIYNDSFHCFACGKNGDIFTFVQEIEHCDFKTAFLSLGGTYENKTMESRMALYRAQKSREKRRIEEDRKKQKLNEYIDDIKFHRYMIGIIEEGTDAFWNHLDKLHMALLLAENMEGGGYK